MSEINDNIINELYIERLSQRIYNNLLSSDNTIDRVYYSNKFKETFERVIKYELFNRFKLLYRLIGVNYICREELMIISNDFFKISKYVYKNLELKDIDVIVSKILKKMEKANYYSYNSEINNSLVTITFEPIRGVGKFTYTFATIKNNYDNGVNNLNVLTNSTIDIENYDIELGEIYTMDVNGNKQVKTNYDFNYTHIKIVD